MSFPLQQIMVEQEFRDPDGYWVYLHYGLCRAGQQGLHIIHEDNRAACYREDVDLCECGGCFERLTTDPQGAMKQYYKILKRIRPRM